MKKSLCEQLDEAKAKVASLEKENDRLQRELRTKENPGLERFFGDMPKPTPGQTVEVTCGQCGRKSTATEAEVAMAKSRGGTWICPDGTGCKSN
jgi:hypothetical protein